MNPRRFKEALNEKGIKSDISKVLLVKWPECIALHYLKAAREVFTAVINLSLPF